MICKTDSQRKRKEKEKKYLELDFLKIDNSTNVKECIYLKHDTRGRSEIK